MKQVSIFQNLVRQINSDLSSQSILEESFAECKCSTYFNVTFKDVTCIVFSRAFILNHVDRADPLDLVLFTCHCIHGFQSMADLSASSLPFCSNFHL